MHLIRKILLLPLIVLCTFSCKKNSSNACGTAWIGGEIVNPKKDFILIGRSRKIIDTVKLDENNFFLYKLEHVDPGIYFISHYEYQAIYVEPDDSLMLRVNTLEFDESLSFTGKGSHRNNFLMDLFLLNEEVDDSLPKYYTLTPEDFESKIDSIKDSRYELFDEYLESKNASRGFKEVAEAGINYGLYAKKELYVSANSRKKVYNENIEIPESFLGFRKEVEYGNEHLRSYYPYYRFLAYHLDNLAYDEYKTKGNYNRNGFLHNYHKNILIDSLISNDSLRNSLLRTNAHRYFVNAEDESNERVILGQFNKFSTHEADKKEIALLAEATIKLTPGHTIPNLMLLTTDNTVKDLHSTLNKPSVIYFWSEKSVKHHRKIHTRARELQAKYPEFDFIAINIDTHFKKWLKTVKNSGYSEINEYQFENFDEAEMKLVINSVNKAMIVDKKGKILDGNTYIFDMGIENQLLSYLNK
ncbi:thioredoxin-like domain-containing protein [Aureisphaera galaxeae]|uniref:TlpA family protein disulfide reductase n=1 Tax=Aureisphaera galaxeae TaxID=1538023 RepID=UPI002350440A|nr:thioredoxin-like domain-containing protein [Aureisphaera galaxeae]MDC8004917.1 thioredoxin-like domain-containing protein [Aureisphaera galaxeae]